MTIYAMLLNSLMVLLIGVAQAAFPAYGRRTIFFSVTVPEQFRETSDARTILRRFRRCILFSTLVAEVFAAAAIYLASLWLQLAAVFVLLAGAILALARARNQSRQYGVAPPTERSAPLSPPSDGLTKSYLALAGAILPFAAAGIFAWDHWDRIPDTAALSNAFAVNGALNAVFLLSGVAILYGARRGSPLRSVNLTVITGVILTNSIATASFTALRWINPFEQFSGQVFPIAWILALAGIIGWGLRRTAQSRDDSDTTPDECWKLALFYFNPQDPAYMVERRIGLGYSPNFAKPLAWIATACFILVPVMVFAGMVIAARK